MNYLMHCWLGRGNTGLVAGGFLGDFIKGKLNGTVDAELEQGLRLHRHIDVQSNRLPSLRSTYYRFGTNLRRPAPILLDLMADHLLARHWDRVADGELCEFTQHCYAAIGSFGVPENAARFFSHMRESDLLARYAQLDVIEDIMVRILKRLHYDHLENELTQRLCEQESGFTEDFETYFKDLQMVAQRWRTTAGIQ